MMPATALPPTCYPPTRHLPAPHPPARHILAYARTLDGGGVERALLRLATEWIASGRRVTLVLGTASGPLAAELPAGIDTVVIGTPRYRSLALRLPAIVRAQRPDLIFCPGSYYTAIAAWTRGRLGVACPPIAGKVSNALDRSDHGPVAGRFHAGWLRLHPHFLDAVVAMTGATATAAITAMRIAPARVSTIANPPARPVPGAATPALPATRFILGVGRLAPQKRWDRLVAMLPLLADHHISLVILGEGRERAALTRQAQALGVADRLWLAGHVADPLPAMTRAALVVLTSDHEGVPGVLREALSVGTPVVATDSSPAIAEIVADPAYGTIVARGDAAALLAALDRWLAADARRPTPIPAPGAESAARYLELFDAIVTGRHHRAQVASPPPSF